MCDVRKGEKGTFIKGYLRSPTFLDPTWHDTLCHTAFLCRMYNTNSPNKLCRTTKIGAILFLLHDTTYSVVPYSIWCCVILYGTKSCFVETDRAMGGEEEILSLGRKFPGANVS
jgi:hypothetical protein